MDAPENTLAALRVSKKKGAKCVEFDVSFTSDNVAVVFHDDDLERITGKSGKITQITFAELRKLNATPRDHLFKEDFPEEKVPTVDEFVDLCLELDLKMIIDVKTWTQPELTSKVILDLFKKRPEMYSKAIVSSFFPHLVYLIRRNDPKVIAAMAWRPAFITYEGCKSDSRRRFSSLPLHLAALLADVLLKWALHDFLWHFIGLSAVLIEKDSLTGGYLQQWREKGIRVIAWTVNNSLQKIYLSNHMRCTILSDSMDFVPIEEFVQNDDLVIVDSSA